MLSENGILYISFPIGVKKTLFNSQRIFSPTEIISWSNEKFSLLQFDYINDNGEFFINVGIDSLPELSYGCGIYKLMKI